MLPVVAWAQPTRGTVTSYHRGAEPNSDAGFNPSLVPFIHGVASGDPLSDRVILWTRVTQADSVAADSVTVDWWIATDPEGVDTVSSGQVITTVSRDYTVKVDADGLEPDQTYYYGFEAFGMPSLTGRTRTAPVGSADHLRFAIVSCSRYQHGYFNAYARIAERHDLSAVIHLGDYIYEYQENPNTRRPDVEPDHELLSLEDYRVRYSFYRLDPDLQAVHQQHPFIIVWDDHEFADDAWVDGARNHQPETEGVWEVRKQNAFRAFFEWMPVRTDTPDRVYRKVEYGGLLDLFMLDTRMDGRDEPDRRGRGGRTVWVSTSDLREQIEEAAVRAGVGADVDEALRTYLDQQTADSVSVDDLLAAAFGEGYAQGTGTRRDGEKRGGDFRRLISDEQYAWLTGGLAASTARWKVLGNQVPLFPTATSLKKLDSWQGYPEERQRLLDFILDAELRNVAAVSGDIHSSWVADIPVDLDLYAQDPDSVTALVEFIAPAVSSRPLGDQLPFSAEQVERLVLRVNDHIRDVDVTKRGYAVLDVTEERLQSDWYFVDTVETPDEGEAFAFGYFVGDGQRTVEEAAGPAMSRAGMPTLAPIRPRANGLSRARLQAVAKPSGGSSVLVIGNYPNPAGDQTRIHYALAAEGAVRVTVYDVLGRRVQTLIEDVQPSGSYSVLLDTSAFPSGTYFYRVEMGHQTLTRSLVVSH